MKVIPKRLKVSSVDNRDSRTTWLWVDSEYPSYVEVDPVDLFLDALRNSATKNQMKTNHAVAELMESFGIEF